MRHSDMRQHLLTTGLKVLHARGFNGCSVQEITDAAKVPKGSFYNHFDSKEQFGAEVLGRYWEERASRAQSVLSDQSLPPLDRLRAYFLARTNEDDPGRNGPSGYTKGCMIGNFSAELAGQSRLVRDRLGAVLAAWTCLLATCIREAQHAGEFGAAIDPETLAAFLIDAFEGAVLRSKVDQNPAALRRFREIVFSQLLT
jgi:TetR/AcrR family transcriptional repressor of nem operon